MSVHETTVKSAPGWWSNLVEARCTCGWRGPIRNLYEPTGKTLAQLDAQEHADGIKGRAS